MEPLLFIKGKKTPLITSEHNKKEHMCAFRGALLYN